MIRCAVFIGLLLMSAQGLSQTEESSDGFWSIQIENDLWGSNDDRFYTQGVKYSVASSRPATDLMQDIADSLPFYKQGETQLHQYEIGQAVFTPEDITRSDLIVGDRPYAGWLYVTAGIGHIYEDRGDRDRLNYLILTLGIVGPSALAEETQDLVHDVFDSTEPQGWSNQLHDELGINVTFLDRSRQIYDFDERRQTELSRHTGLVIGNVYSYASVGFVARYGTYLKSDIGPPSIQPGFPGAPAFNPNRRSNWYLFAGIEARAMMRNIFLDGNTNVDSHRVEKEDWVADLQFGVAYHFENMRVSFVQLFRTREFVGQPESTQYGAINFTFFEE